METSKNHGNCADVTPPLQNTPLTNASATGLHQQLNPTSWDTPARNKPIPEAEAGHIVVSLGHSTSISFITITAVDATGTTIISTNTEDFFYYVSANITHFSEQYFLTTTVTTTTTWFSLQFSHFTSLSPLIPPSSPGRASRRYKGASKPRGVSNRNAGLKWLKTHASEGVIYFADDDNTYDYRIFQEVGLASGYGAALVGLAFEWLVCGRGARCVIWCLFLLINSLRFCVCDLKCDFRFYERLLIV